MKSFSSFFLVAIILVTVCLASPPLLAAQPETTGQNKNKAKGSNSKSKHNKSNSGSIDVDVDIYFTDDHRDVISKYFAGVYNAGSCPPGLAKKNNGCMPPGQVKKWHRGQPLPHDLPYYDLPEKVLRDLGRAPEGHKFVRVAADILLIAIGTGMVIDAIEDLSEI